jgi:hypothetical protein
MDYEIKNEFESLLYQSNKNKSFKLIWDIIYYTRLLKYVHQKQYKEIRDRLRLAATKKTLSQLCSLNYLKEVDRLVFCTTDKAIELLNKVKYRVPLGYGLDLLPEEPVGKAGINEMNNTDVFIEALKLQDYYALLYPHFEYLVPDALLVQKNDHAYKLTFLEVEKPKSNWQTYLEDKKQKYLRLSQDINFYNYWLNTSLKLGLTMPELKNLKFSICIVGNIIKDFGEGFIFKPSLLPK